uniref:Prickle-like protein 2 n=1 Tax=Rhabditophanes sp. KR3021 TaxID=114890 RepID=A0AC35U7F8_9BILA
MTTEYTIDHHLNPYLRKLELKPKHTLCHELGAGSPCLKCECPGLDLHFWRKICKQCSCRMDEHDVIVSSELDHGAHIRKLLMGHVFSPTPSQNENLNYSHNPSTAIFHKRGYSSGENTINTIVKPSVPLHKKNDDGDELYGRINKTRTPRTEPVNKPNSRISNSLHMSPNAKDNATYNHGNGNKTLENDRHFSEYTWLPQGPTIESVMTYMNALPFKERPIQGTEGDQVRRTKLAYQLPYHDSDPTACKSLVNDVDKKLHQTFVDTIKSKVVGVGQIVDNIPNKSKNFSTQTNDYQNVDCHNCNTHTTNSTVLVDTSQGPGKDLFHPNCFKCDTCEQLLVDLLYFFHDGKYYCGRHYGEKMYSRCFGCDELIFQREYTVAEEKEWHVEHFCCFGCDMALGGHKYCTKDEKPFCIPCYMNKFAKKCLTCNEKIAPDCQRLTHNGEHWHASASCFRCETCLTPLHGLPFMLMANKIFCSGNCKRKFQQ